MGIAKRLSQLGINAVRLHQMDAFHIWNEDKTNFSPKQLDKLHYFMYCLHQNGIYVYISLHVTYLYPQEEFTSELQEVFLYGKALDRFYEPFIQVQIKYIRDLIGSFNNYTNCHVYEDPGVAFIELNNENDINLLIDNIDHIRKTVFYDSLIAQWRSYLKEKFETYDNFYKRLNVDPIDSSIDLAESTTKKINLGSSNENTFDENDGKYNLHIKAKGTSSISFQLLKMQFFKSSTFYSIKFQASAKTPITASVTLQYGVSKFEAVATGVRIELTEEEQEYTIEMKTVEDLNETKPIQLSIIFNKDTINEYVVTKPRIFMGKKTWDPPGGDKKSLDYIEIPDCRKNSNDSLEFQAEYRLFLNYIQEKTQERLFNVIKKEFNCKAQVTDSQANYGNYLTFHREYTHADYLDIHYYWQHPKFEEGHSFQIGYYSMKNAAMVDNIYANCSLFKMLSYVGYRRPFSISELNNPFPNEHQHETFPMIASWAAYHDFDSFFQFSYGQRSEPKDTAYIDNFFQMASNPVLMTTAPIAAMMFRSFAVKTANSSMNLKIPKKALFNANEKRAVYYNNFFSRLQRNLCWKPTRIEFTDDDNEEVKLDSDECNESNSFPYKTEEITWKFDSENKGVYIVDSERVKTATGHVKTVEFDSFKFEVELENQDENTATVGVTSLDMKPLEQSEKILLSVVGRTMNTDQVWDKDKTTTKNGWGKAPVLAECLKISGSFLNGKNARLIVLNKDGQDNGTLQLTYDENL